MKLKIAPVFLYMLLNVFCYTNGTGFKILTLEEAVNLALENNINIKLSKKSLEILKAKDKYSWNSVSPSLNVNTVYNNSLENEISSFSVSANINFLITPHLFSSIRSAKLDYESGIISFKEALRKTEAAVRKAFYGLIFAQENIALQKRNLETAESQYNQNQEKFKNGKISELDVFTSRVNYESKKTQAQAADAEFETSLVLLKQLIGIDKNTKIQLSGSLNDVLKIKEIKLSEQSGNLNIQSAEKKLEIADENILNSKIISYAPSFSAGYNFGRTENFNSGNSYINTINQISLSVSIPLDSWLPWSKEALNINSAKILKESALIELENMRTDIAVQTENYVRKINHILSQINSLQTNAELAKETYRMAKTAYNYGKTDFSNLQNASDNVLSAEVNLKSQAYNLISTLIDLENISGIEFGSLGK